MEAKKSTISSKAKQLRSPHKNWVLILSTTVLKSQVSSPPLRISLATLVSRCVVCVFLKFRHSKQFCQRTLLRGLIHSFCLPFPKPAFFSPVGLQANYATRKAIVNFVDTRTQKEESKWLDPDWAEERAAVCLQCVWSNGERTTKRYKKHLAAPSHIISNTGPRPATLRKECAGTGY